MSSDARTRGTGRRVGTGTAREKARGTGSGGLAGGRREGVSLWVFGRLTI